VAALVAKFNAASPAVVARAKTATAKE